MCPLGQQLTHIPSRYHLFLSRFSNLHVAKTNGHLLGLYYSTSQQLCIWSLIIFSCFKPFNASHSSSSNAQVLHHGWQCSPSPPPSFTCHHLPSLTMLQLPWPSLRFSNVLNSLLPRDLFTCCFPYLGYDLPPSNPFCRLTPTTLWGFQVILPGG